MMCLFLTSTRELGVPQARPMSPLLGAETQPFDQEAGICGSIGWDPSVSGTQIASGGGLTKSSQSGDEKPGLLVKVACSPGTYAPTQVGPEPRLVAK